MVATFVLCIGLGLAQAPTDNALSWQKQGLEQFLQNRYEPAAKALREALKRDPRLWTAHLFLGMSLYRLNQFEPALQALESAEKLAPAQAQGRDDVDYWLGATRIALRRPLAGLQSIERLLARNPRHADALQLATETYAELGSSLWNHVAERSFDSAVGQQVHGYALESEGNRGGAIEAFRRSVELDPSRPGAGASLGRLLLASGESGQARAVLLNEVRLNPSSAEANLYLGLLELRENRAAAAIPWLEKAITHLPGNEEPALALAQAWLAAGNAVQAARAARQAVSASPGSMVAHELLLAALAGDVAGIQAENERWNRRQR